ncbi:MAG: methyltransferase domain-containing protein [Crocinitomicaceae bacterium]|nr:methyltransferase domain-containing protein [Crocinitomicaceae bacterium]
MKCRFDGKSLEHIFIDLGFSPPSNSFISPEELNHPETYYPLRLYVSERSFLVQTEDFQSGDEIFDEDYIYFSSFSKSWLAHSKAYTEMMTDRFGYNENSLVTEIASNDGYLLQYFKELNIPVLGIEPTMSTAKVSMEKGIENIVEFFGEKLARKLVDNGKKSDLLLGNNVLAHVPDINDFVKGLKIALNDDGVITMEFPHLLRLVTEKQFDTIYHEHFSYLSFYTVSMIFKEHGLEMFDVEEISTHGGSLRIFAKHEEDTTKETSERVKILLDKEIKAGINTLDFYKDFQGKSNKIKNDFLAFLIKSKNEEKTVVGYGAAAKGNTLLNYAGVKVDLIDFVVDASPYKQGKLLPGSHIPVVNEEEIKRVQPDYVIIFPWNIKTEIMSQLDYIREWNGEFVIAIPELQIL